MEDEKQSIVLFPFMGQGHIIPFLALALQIEQVNTNYAIYFVNTPLNLKKLRSSLPSYSSIRFLEIPFSSSSHGLPPDSENFDTLPYHLILRLYQASASLQFKSSFKEAIQALTARCHGRPPLCIISDIFLGWTANVAKQLGVYHAIFSGTGGFGLACYVSLWLNLPHRNVVAHDFSLPDFKEGTVQLHKTQLPTNIAEADGEDDWSIFQRENLSAWVDSQSLLFNTVEEFDQIGLSYFRRKFPGLHVRPIGPLVLRLKTRDRIGNTTGVITRETILKWLDSKPSNSVLYVSFGSMNTISSSQMMQLAKALEASQKNFIWVVRPPIEVDINSEFNGKEWLPEGFEERNRATGRGLVVQNWAPQVEILSHRAVSAFLSHCGWNSVMESLGHGVPLMGWPLAGEQFFNAKYLEEEMGVCVEVGRGKKSEVNSEDVVKKMEEVMEEKKEIMRRNVEKVKETMEKAWEQRESFNGSSAKSFHDFLSDAQQNHQQTSDAKEWREMER
ncbi:UDP-glycosyltransferase 92A1 [Cucumis melo var. makuwa]|uniref:Glycosyltransferase n=2 Tax=Cucumis melo TaxID=3656 RepID=A0A1S3BMQ5_CUCME|nr:UDP-glycosyltransferase 92A1 [Cucumis melo]KAA0041386.1 UDP-glycosyltransferase 92A1 [Cucumis melo var. makuwa]